jgi:siderophore synthetase component
MARSKGAGNGKLDKLDEALRALVQAQATLVQSQAAAHAQIAEAQRQIAETQRQNVEGQRRSAEFEQMCVERFARIEAILLEHSRILHALPDAVRDKIGFRSPPPS